MGYSKENLDQQIRKTFADTFMEQAPGLTLPDLTDGTVLLETGLDSLGFAILITRLEETLDYDPFTRSDEPFYPRTYGELLSFYFKFQPE